MKNKMIDFENISSSICGDLYLSERFESIWHDIGNICSNYGLSKYAIFSFENAIRHKVKGSRNLYRIGREFIFLHNTDKLGDVIKNIREFPNANFEFDVLVGHALLFKNNLEKANLYFKNALKLREPDMLLLYGIAKWNDAAQRSDLAFKYFLEILKRYPDHNIKYEVQFRIGVLCKYQNALEHSMRYFNALYGRGIVSDENILIQIATLHELKDEDDEAIKICTDVVKSKSNSILAYRVLGYLLIKNERYKDAITVLKRGMQTCIDPYLSFLIGKAYTALNLLDDAYEGFSNALNISKHDYVIWNSFGIMYYNSNQLEDAVYCLKNAINCKVDAYEPLYNMILVRKIQNATNTEIKRMIISLIGISGENEDLMNMLDNIGSYEYFKGLSCREKIVNVSFTTYLATHIFFGGKSMIKIENFNDLDPIK